MDLEKELLKKQSLTHCNRIIKWIGLNETRFGELMKLFFNGEYRLTQHAAWPMSYCIRNHPLLAKPYYKKFIDLLSDEKAHPAVRRNIVRLFSLLKFQKDTRES